MDPQQPSGMLPQQQPLPPPPAPSSPSQPPQQFPSMQPGFMPRGYQGQPRPILYYGGVPQPGFVPPPFAQPVFVQYPPRGGIIYRPPGAQGYMPPMQAQPPMPPQPMMPQQQQPQQPQVPPQPYKKREKKPLLIVDPKTNAAVEIKAVQPAAQAQQPPPPASPAMSPSPVPAPMPTPPQPPQQADQHHPTPAEEMRLKALAAKSAASPALGALTSKMEGLKIDQMSTDFQLSGPRTIAPPQQPPVHIPVQQFQAPVQAQAPKITAPPQVPVMPTERKESPPAASPPPLVVSAPSTSTPAAAPPSVAGESTEDRKAKAKRDFEEKRQKQLELEREEAARKEDDTKRAEEAKRKEQPPGPPSFSNVAARSLNEPKPQISLPLPTPVVPSPQTTPTNAANGGASRGERIVYSKDDLIAFRGSEACNRPPPDLHPDFQDFQPRARPQRRPRDGAAAPPRVGAAPPQVGSDWRNKPQANTPGAGPAVPPLKSNPNAWKRTAATTEEEAAIRKIRAILNKLAKDNFEALSKQVLEIPITSRTLLEDVIQEIFDKALMEPSFGPVYAQLCKEISEKSGGEWDFVSAVQRDNQWFWTASTDHSAENCFKGPDANNPDVGYASEQEALEAAKKANAFKRLLLNRCQIEFEKNSFEEIDAEEKEIRETGEANSDEVKQKLQAVEGKRRRIKKRVLGNIAFIGELFLKRMLSTKIIHTCIIGLLGEEAIQSPETFFDSEKKREVASEDIECICKLFQTVGKDMDQGDNVPTVDRYFKFLSLLERHLPRASRQRFMIKDILDLRQNRWQEKRETLKVSTKEEVRQKQVEQEMRGSGGFQGDRDRGGNRGQGYGGPPQGRANPAPSGRFQQNAPTSAGGAARAPLQSNRFAQGATTTKGPQPGLVAGGAVKSPAPVASPASSTAVPRVGGTPTVTKPTPTPPAVASPAPVQATSGAKKGESISEDKLKTSFGAALEEFLVNQNVTELADELKNLCDRFDNSTKAKEMLVSMLIDRIIEKKDAERQALTKVMPALIVEHNVFPIDLLLESLLDKLEFLNDILIDSPKAGTHLAALVRQLSQGKALTMEQVSACLENLRKKSPDDADQFSKDLQEAFGSDASKIAQLQSGAGSSSSWVSKFNQLVRDGEPEDDILQFLSGCPQDEIVSKGPELVEVVFEHVARKAGASQGAASEAQVKEERVQVTELKNVLKRLLQNGSQQGDHQVKGLSTLAALAKRNQADGAFLRRIFELLYREEVVSEEALLRWRDGAEKRDQDALADFFKWLAEAQPESNDDK